MADKVIVTKNKLDALANSISAKSGESLPMTIAEMKDAVDGIQTGGTAAISVVDTTDSHGGTVREITSLDISDTTAVAGDVAQGKYFYTAQGVKTQGTGSGGLTPYQTVTITSDMITDATGNANAVNTLCGFPTTVDTDYIYLGLVKNNTATGNYKLTYIITSPSSSLTSEVSALFRGSVTTGATTCVASSTNYSAYISAGATIDCYKIPFPQ